ncbi:MAG: primosomal protein N' [Alistipes sp.]|nr:primosomal protein N' [Alistipes sp.]
MPARYADIVLPLAQPAYTFSVGDVEGVAVGDAVTVQFGARSIYTGIVLRLHDTPPQGGRAKPILARLYERPLLPAEHIRLWEWIADYYMCSIGEVMRVALPSLIKSHALSDEDYHPYTPRTVKFLRLNEAFDDEPMMERMSRRAPRRYAVVEQLRSAGGELPRSAVAADAAQVAALVKAGIVEVVEREASATEDVASERRLPDLSPAQSEALQGVREGLKQSAVALLHGVTSSGKTEIYTHIIDQTLARGEDVLYLVPEISLTTQLVSRLRGMFGERVVSHHSKLTPAQRTRTFMEVSASDGGNLVVGARSALFLPFRRLGLVIVDEEHDGGYKQSDTAPRYNGRDVAVMLASLYGAKCLMGSATPSLESYSNVMRGKYAYVRLTERYGGVAEPEIIISDTLWAVKRGERKSHFNKELLDRIGERLERHEQVILFQNRRGYSSYMECSECGYTPRCGKCNVTLTPHTSNGTLRCHYCGHTQQITHLCPRCGRGEMRPMGFGTERVEQEISRLFPQARVMRLDGDTMTSDGACRRMIEAFARGEADVLVGTQIVAKGLDFGRVTLIGVLNADNLLNAPDFRAVERGWQMLMQVAGRCGRRDRRGEVVVQTSDPAHPLFGWMLAGEYSAMAAAMLAERHLFKYPPYSRLVRITLRDTDPQRVSRAAVELATSLRSTFGPRVVGPATPLVDCVRGWHIVEIMLKVEVEASMSRARGLVRRAVDAVRGRSEYRNTVIICDVDVL